MPLPLEWLDRVEPLPGELLVKRDWEYKGQIELPDYYVAGIKTAIATVVMVALGVNGVKPGDRVALAIGVTRFIEFGKYGADETLYACKPAELLGKVVDESVREVLIEAGWMIHPTVAEELVAAGQAEEVW